MMDATNTSSSAAAASSSDDDALNEAMSMLDSLSAQENNNNGGNLHNDRTTTNNNNTNNNVSDRSDSNTGFAIDSDDDDDDDEFNLDELNDELLEGIDLNEGGGSSNNNDVAEGGAAVTTTSEDFTNNNTTAASNNNNSEMMEKEEDPSPSQQQQNDDAVNSSSLSSEKSVANNNNLNSNTATSSTTFVHPLQDMGTTTASNNDSNNNNTRQSSWTTNLSTNLVSFAKVASASLQSAVESAKEEMLIHNQGEPTQQQLSVGGPNTTHAANNSNIASAVTTGGGVPSVGGGQQKAAISSSAASAAAAPMTYQERQRLLHQQYHAANNNNSTVGNNNNISNTAAVNMGGVAAAATMSSSQPKSMSPMKKKAVATTSSSTFTSPTRAAAGAGATGISSSSSTPRASPITNNSTTPTAAATTVVNQHSTSAVANSSSSSSPTKASPTFLDNLTTNLDTQTKNALILQALKGTSSLSSNNNNNNNNDDDTNNNNNNNTTTNNNNEVLLPGERIIMFINNLRDVQDSRYGHLFVGSGEVGMSVCMRDCLDGKMMLMDEDVAGAGGSGSAGGAGSTDNATTTTVWCCVMTFYRVILFSYQVGSEDGRVLLDSNNNIDGEEQGGGGGGKKKKNETTVVEQWLKSRNVSVQFQAAHCSHPSSSTNRKKHHVFQMPLASIERVEKVLSSSQSSLSNTSMNSGSNIITGGGSLYTNNYLPSSNSAVSSASSAMSQLGNQMKPLTGLVAGIAAANAGVGGGGSGGGGGSSNNLLTNGTNSGVMSSSPSSGSGASGPLGIIIHGKDGGRWIRFSTSSYTDAARAHEALNTYAFPGRRNLGYLFAFESRRTEVIASSGGGGTQQMGGGSGEGGGNPIATATPPTRRRFVAMEEFSRQGIVKGGGPIGGVTQSTPWTVIHANAKNYGLCSTYPSVLVVPRSIVGSDDGNNLDSGGMGVLRRCAAFRSENRFPVLTWGGSEHGGSIWRSSQPKVGLQGYRSSEDERYLYAIGEEAKRANLAADARADGGVGSGSSHRPPIEFLRMLCGRNNESDLIMEGSNSSCMLKIMDMRPKSAAMANRTQGYGYENTNYYRGSTINFYGIGNIHAVRDAYQKVNALCLNPNTSDIQWMQLVENTNWPSMTRLILSASWQTAFHVHYNRLPILLHCSHGWDRTSQVSALAQLLLDPHYRTREGFSTLVEKDFLSFGHPFHTRSGHGEGKNEQGGDEGQLSPIFLQFLDCVFQLVNQFPNYFEFNARYLLLLSENIYSCRFGTLLCDSEREREVVAGIRQRTYCMWDHLDSISDLVNPLFNKAANADAGVLMMPLPMLLRNVTLWTDRLCMYGAKATIPCMPTVGSEMDGITNLHTSVDETTGSLQRAIADSHMWKETALTALKEVEELRLKLSEKNE